MDDFTIIMLLCCCYCYYHCIGYKELFVDEDATCVVSGSMSLKTAQCVNVCYRKVKQSKAGAGFDLWRSFLAIFNRQ